MADKIKKSYKFNRSFYDDAITLGKWWSKLYSKLLWGGVYDKHRKTILRHKIKIIGYIQEIIRNSSPKQNYLAKKIINMKQLE